jgi:hypothetical protein
MFSRWQGEGNYLQNLRIFRAKDYEHCYTFLHGTGKGVKNDKVGKKIAKGRLDELLAGSASSHKFEFEEGDPPTTPHWPPRPN